MKICDFGKPQDCVPFNLQFSPRLSFFIESNYLVESKILIKLENSVNMISYKESYIALNFIYLLSHRIMYVLLTANPKTSRTTVVY